MRCNLECCGSSVPSSARKVARGAAAYEMVCSSGVLRAVSPSSFGEGLYIVVISSIISIIITIKITLSTIRTISSI